MPAGSAAVTNSVNPEISVVVPCKDEADNLAELVDEIAGSLEAYAFEVIVVDDGSTDGTADLLAEFDRERSWLRHFRHARSCGQSAAVRTGLLNARGDIVVTIDGDGQNDPAFIPDLLTALREGGSDVALAAGQRVGRKASRAKRYASVFANWLRSSILKDKTRDSGCGLKAVRRDVFLKLPYFDSWHRFMAALVIREGYDITHVDVVDRPRLHGQSKYGIFDRGVRGALDLFGVWWLRRRRKVVPEILKREADDR